MPRPGSMPPPRRTTWPAQHTTTCSASLGAPCSRLRPRRLSDFICPLVASIALRRLIIACRVLVIPRLCPERGIYTLSSSVSREPRSTIAVLGLRSARMLTCSIASPGVCPSYGGGPGIERIRNTRPSLSVVATVTFTPNSYGVGALTLLMRSTSGA